MSKPEEFDVKSITGMIPVFGKIDKEVEEFYKFLKEKDIEPKSPTDIERIERFFNKTLKAVLELMDNSSFNINDKELMKARLILDMHGNFAEKFNIDFMTLPTLLGAWNEEIFKNAMENLIKYS